MRKLILILCFALQACATTDSSVENRLSVLERRSEDSGRRLSNVERRQQTQENRLQTQESKTALIQYNVDLQEKHIKQVECEAAKALVEALTGEINNNGRGLRVRKLKVVGDPSAQEKARQELADAIREKEQKCAN